MVGHVFDGHRHGGGKPKLDHPEGIPDQYDIHSGFVQEPGGRKIIGGERDDLFMPPLFLLQRQDRDLIHGRCFLAIHACLPYFPSPPSGERVWVRGCIAVAPAKRL